MITINREDVLAFASNASRIRTNEIMPVLKYVKLDKAELGKISITKSNLKEFVSQRFNITGFEEPILIEEQILINFCTYCDGGVIYIDKTDGKIRISDGITSATSSSEDVGLFPSNDKPSTEWFELAQQLLDAINSCRNCIGEEGKAFKDHIFIKGKTIAASDGAIGFATNLVIDYPEMILRKSIADALQGKTTLSFASNNSYYFFKDATTTFGFSQSDQVPFVDVLHKFIMKPESDVISFTANKEDIIRFNNLCIASNKSKLINIEWKAGGTGLYAVMDDSAYNIMIEKTIGVNSMNDVGLKYQPSLMNALLSAIPTEVCYFYKGNQKYFITDENKTFSSVIAGIV